MSCSATGYVRLNKVRKEKAEQRDKHLKANEIAKRRRNYNRKNPKEDSVKKYQALKTKTFLETSDISSKHEKTKKKKFKMRI